MSQMAATTGDARVVAEGPRQGVVNLWQRGVPVLGVPLMTPAFLLMLTLVLIGTVIGVWRLLAGSLGSFAGMTDAYAWGVWKTFNVMALTALGSGAMAVGFAAWVLGYKHLHTVMRTALITSLLFYATGLLGIATDVGRPWNFWNALLPWRWNTHSAMWEVSIAMPFYAVVFLLFENSPLVVERLWYRGSKGARAFIRRWRPRMRRIYPFMVAGALVVPMMHQSSLGGLLLLAGDKVHPLWQTTLLPLLYLLQAGICGFGAVILFLMGSGLVWRRPLDMKVLGDLGGLLSKLTFVWFGVRMVDIAAQGKLGYVFALDRASLIFLVENLMVLIPAVVLSSRRARTTPRLLLKMAVLGTLGGLVYRFNPTTITFDPGPTAQYFPTVPEVFITVGLIALAVAAFTVAAKLFAVLPAPMSAWYRLVDLMKTDPRIKRDDHGNPIDD